MDFPVVKALELSLVAVLVLTVYCMLTMSTLLCLTALVVLWAVYRREKRKAAGTIPLTDKYVLITGCDTGFGHALAQRLHKLGCHVIATVLQPDGPGAKELRALSSSKMTVLPLDVSSDDSVSKCLSTVKKMFGQTGLWGLVNNAGLNVMGEVELMTMRQYLHVANINIFGMVRTVRAFLPLIRQCKGRIVNVTSIKGLVSTPYNAAYNITKYGGETFSDIVRMEMAQFGVKVSIIEPGNFGGATGCLNAEGIKRIGKDFDEMWDNASEEVKELFGGKRHLDSLLQSLVPAAEETYPSLDPVLDAMVDALTSGDPEIRYLIDGSNKLLDRYCMLARIKPYTPGKLFDRLVSYCFPYSIGK